MCIYLLVYIYLYLQMYLTLERHCEIVVGSNRVCYCDFTYSLRPYTRISNGHFYVVTPSTFVIINIIWIRQVWFCENGCWALIKLLLSPTAALPRDHTCVCVCVCAIRSQSLTNIAWPACSSCSEGGCDHAFWCCAAAANASSPSVCVFLYKGACQSQHPPPPPPPHPITANPEEAWDVK